MHTHKLNSPIPHRMTTREKIMEVLWIIAGIIVFFLACGMLTMWQI
ncbi:MAG: hypothetical protein ACYTFY_18360 [Planctomycetota bacterium]|jgi:hypothetical protein